jgi:co-chaperonin GroES (HSP10)
MSIPTIKPRKSWVLVKPDGEESRETEHGIIMPSNVEQEQKAIGTIVDIGDEVFGLFTGQKVIYGAFAGEKLKFQESSKDVDFLLLHNDDILAIITV